MTMETYPWDLEERIEDAFVAYLKAKVTRVAMVTSSFDPKKAEFPLVVVDAGDGDNKNDTAPFTGKRKMDVTIALTIEAINNNGDAGEEAALETARQQFRAIRSELLGWIAGNDLHIELNSVGIDGVKFSQAFMTAQSRDAGSGRIIMEQMVEVIAQPVVIGE